MDEKKTHHFTSLYLDNKTPIDLLYCSVHCTVSKKLL